MRDQSRCQRVNIASNENDRGDEPRQIAGARLSKVGGGYVSKAFASMEIKKEGTYGRYSLRVTALKEQRAIRSRR